MASRTAFAGRVHTLLTVSAALGLTLPMQLAGLLVQAPQASAASFVYSEDFSSSTAQDTAIFPPASAGTADWNTGEGLLTPKKASPSAAGFYKLDGITPGASNATNTVSQSIVSNDGTMVTDSQGLPWLATQEPYPDGGADFDIWVIHWNGSRWVDVAGNDYDSGAVCPPSPNCTFGAKVNVLDTADAGTRQVMALDSSDRPQVAWQECDVGDCSGSSLEIYFAKWNGVDWVSAAGTTTPADYNVTSGASWHGFSKFQRPSLHIRSDGQPALAFMGKSAGDPQILFTYWDGSTWANANGTTTDADYNVSNGDSGFSRHPVFALTATDDPIIAWYGGSQAPGASEIYVSRWNGSLWADPTGTTAWSLAGGLSNPSGGNGRSNQTASIALSSTGLIAVTWGAATVGTNWYACALTTDCDVFYAQLDPAAVSPVWNGPDGTPFTGTAFSPGTDVMEWFPTLRFDAQDQPLVVYGRMGAVSGNEAVVTTWNGASWTELGNAIPNISDIYLNPNSIAFDAIGGFWVDTIGKVDGDFGGIVEDHFVSHWIDPYAGATNGFYDLANTTKGAGTNVASSGTTTAVSKHAVAIDSQNRPHVVWAQDVSGADDVFYAYWDGTQWLSFKDTTVAADFNVSNSPAASTEPALMLGFNDQPHVAWTEDLGLGNTEILEVNAGSSAWLGENSSTYAIGCIATTCSKVNVSSSLTPSSGADLKNFVVSGSDYPRVAWIDGTGIDDDDVYVSEWDDVNWAKPSTGAAGFDDVSGSLVTPAFAPGCSVVRHDGLNADLAVDPSGDPGVTWQLPWDRVGCTSPSDDGSFNYVLYSEFNAISDSTWSGVGGGNDCTGTPVGFGCNVISGDGQEPSAEFKTNNRIAIVWRNVPNVAGDYGVEFDAILEEYDGAVFNVTNVSPTNTTTHDPDIAFDGTGDPVVWFNDAGNEEVAEGLIVRRLPGGFGSGWVGMDRTDNDGQATRYEYTRGGLGSTFAAAALDTNGDPYVVFNGSSPTDPFIAHWHEPTPPPFWQTQSLTVDSTTDDIARATITNVADPALGSIQYKLSNDGGANFYNAIVGVPVAFPTLGSDLRWRAKLNNAQNVIATGPIIDSLSIAYETPALVASESGGSTTMTEGGATDTLIVVLTSQPAADVDVSVTPDAQSTVSAGTLTFTAGNFSTPQVVTATAVNDTAVEGAHTSTIAFGATSSDPHYDSRSATVTASLTDNDTAPSPTPAPLPPTPVVPTSSERIEGNDATEISINVSEEIFTAQSADGAVIANDQTLIDGFVGGPLAGRINGPILLNNPTVLESEVLAELTRVLKDKTKTIFLLGGSKALSANIVDSLASNGFTSSERIGGINRRHTAALVADAIAARNPSTPLVYLSEDSMMVDAFAASAAAANLGVDSTTQPILLTGRGSTTLDSSTKAFINGHADVATVSIMGGTQAVPAAIETQLRATGQLTNINRFAGANRFSTAALFSQQLFSVPTVVTIASGDSADVARASALEAGLVAAQRGGPLVLTRATDLPSETLNYLATNAASLNKVTVVGSVPLVSQAVQDFAANLI